MVLGSSPVTGTFSRFGAETLSEMRNSIKKYFYALNVSVIFVAVQSQFFFFFFNGNFYQGILNVDGWRVSLGLLLRTFL